MKILALTCNHCGAPLEVPAKTRFLTCTFCSSQLEVHRSGNAAYTEVLKALQEQAEQVADDVETLKLKRDLDELDRKWIEERKRHVIMTDTTIFPFIQFHHRIFCYAFFYADKNFRMAQFTSIPDCMLLMGKNNVGHSFHLGLNLEVLLGNQFFSFN